MNNVSQWLRRAGIQTPYEDMTEAQIQETNKSNPLGGYGYMSAHAKAQRAQQMAAYEEAMRREQEMYNQQLLARMSSQQQIGHHMGSGLMGLVGLLKGKGQPQAQPDMGDDPQVEQYNKLMQEGMQPDVALEMVGKDSGNGQMIADAMAQRAEREKAELEKQDLSQKVADPNRYYEHKPGYSEERDVEGPGGVPYVERWTLLRNSKDGGIWKVVSRGPKGGVQGTPGDFGKGKSDTSNTVQDFETAQVATANALDAMDKAENLVKENPSITGWAGRLISKADDIRAGVKGLTDLGGWEGEGDPLDISKYTWESLEKTAAGSDKLRALVLELAAARAAAIEPGGRFSEGDVQRQIEQIGGKIANPRTFLEVLQQARETMVDNLFNKGRYMTVGGRPVGEQYKTKLEEFNKRIGRGSKKAPAVGEVRNGYRFNGGNPKDKNNWEKVE